MSESQDRLMLPWTSEGKESLRFKSILIILFIVLFIVSVWIPSIVLPEKDRKTLEKLPPQLAKLVKKAKAPEPVKKVEPKKEKKKKVEKKPEPKKDKPKTKPKKKEPVKISKPKPQVKLKDPELKKKVKAAQEVAKKSGLLALQDDLADLRSAVDISALNKKAKPKKAKTIAATATGGPNSQQVLARSSGIKTDTLTAPAETVALAALAGAELDATLDEQALAKAEEEAASRVKYRSEKSINLIVERLKGSLITLYNRERRKDPFLEGLLVVEVIIEPSGSVSSCRVISSELNHEVLEKKMVNRIYLTDFGPEEVEQTTKNIPCTFNTE
jgi:outer membrane biosynthesis protein TonB